MNWEDDYWLRRYEEQEHTRSYFSSGRQSGKYSRESEPDFYMLPDGRVVDRDTWKAWQFAQHYGTGFHRFAEQFFSDEPEDRAEGYRDERGCRTWLNGRWVDDEEVARKEWTPSLIYSYELVIPDNALELGVDDGAFVITSLDKVTGTDIALVHEPRIT